MSVIINDNDPETGAPRTRTFYDAKLYAPSFLWAGQYAAQSGGAFSQGVMFTPVFLQSTQYAAQANGAFPDGIMFTPAFMQSVSYSNTKPPGAFENGKKIHLYGVAKPDYPTVVINDNDPLTGIPRVRTFTKANFIQKGDILDFVGTPRYGRAALTVHFTDLTEPHPSSWLWTFGDGHNSNLENPNHTYLEPGIYTVTLRVKIDGVFFFLTKKYYITVWPGGLKVANTGTCLRLAVKPEQGKGWSELYGAGWVYPETRVGAFMVTSDIKQRLPLVFDARKGRPYLLATKTGPAGSGLVKRYEDKYGPYGGTEIEWECWLKEHFGEKKEMLIRFLQGHVAIRAENEQANQGQPGYTSKGYRNEQQISLFALVDGNKVELARTENIPENGDIPFDRKVEGRRVQLGVAGTASELLLTGIGADYEMKDLRAAPALRIMDHHNRQASIGAPIVWISRGSVPLLNRADGAIASGAITGTATGPDGWANSAMILGPASSISAPCASLSGDYTIMVFVSSIAASVDICNVGALVVSILKAGAAYILQVTDGANYQHLMSWLGTGWVAIKITRTGNVLELSENGLPLDSFILPGVNTFAGPFRMQAGNQKRVFDIRLLPNTVSNDDHFYYYNNVTQKDGDAVLPNF